MTGSSKIKFLGIDRCFSDNQGQLCNIYRSVGTSGQVVGGPHVTFFENNCKQISNRQYAISVANASDGLFLSLIAAGIGPGDEILTTAYSFFATAESISRTGATPIFVDVDDHYHLDLSKAIVSERTRAIVVVNLFGDCVNFNEFEEFANRHSLLLFEDAAQSLYSSWNNIPSGKLGVASIYSFAPSKNIPGFSHGGCVVTDNEQIYRDVLVRKLHGKWNGLHEIIGYNSIMSSFEAAQINYFMEMSDSWQARRTSIAEYFNNELQHLVEIPKTREHVVHSWHKYVIKPDNRTHVQECLTNSGIETSIHYAKLIPHEPAYNEKLGKYPVAQALSNCSLTIPLYPELNDSEVEYIVKCLRTCL